MGLPGPLPLWDCSLVYHPRMELAQAQQGCRCKGLGAGKMCRNGGRAWATCGWLDAGQGAVGPTAVIQRALACCSGAGLFSRRAVPGAAQDAMQMIETNCTQVLCTLCWFRCACCAACLTHSAAPLLSRWAATAAVPLAVHSLHCRQQAVFTPFTRPDYTPGFTLTSPPVPWSPTKPYPRWWHSPSCSWRACCSATAGTSSTCPASRATRPTGAGLCTAAPSTSWTPSPPPPGTTWWAPTSG